jgi:hypothetical protein
MLKKDFPPVIISGFPGVGKTYLCQHRKDLKISDSDSSSFSWDESSGKKVRHPDWPDNYVKHIKSLVDAKDHDLILVSSHLEVREALSEAGLKFVLVYPSMAIKEEYIQRYVDRGNNESFVGLLEKNYDDWIDALRQSTPTKVELGPGQYLADVVDRIIAILTEFGEPEIEPEIEPEKLPITKEGNHQLPVDGIERFEFDFSRKTFIPNKTTIIREEKTIKVIHNYSDDEDLPLYDTPR